MLPDRLRARLREQVASARQLHEMDVRSGFGAVSMPVALARKYPSAAREWCCSTSFLPIDRQWIREPMSCGVTTSATNRSSARCAKRFARRESPSPRRLIRFDIRLPSICSRPGATSAPVQALLRHSDVSTTMIYTHVSNRGGRGVVSPLDRLEVETSPPDDAYAR